MRSYAKGTIPWLLWVCAALLIMLGCSGSQPANEWGSKSLNLDHVDRLYARMKKTELSDLYPNLSEIIKARLTCYSSNVQAIERVRECRKDYVRSIVGLCRSHIKSAPRLGDSILCFQYCPITQALCKGDNIDCMEENCVAQEARCIEYCLDRFWRGGAYPGGTLLP